MKKISFDLVVKNVKNVKKPHVLVQTDHKSPYSIVSKSRNYLEFIVYNIKSFIAATRTIDTKIPLSNLER